MPRKQTNDPRSFMVCLYPDNQEDLDLMSLWTRVYKYAYILHDRDKWTEEDQQMNPDHRAGELKKPHYHFLFRFPNQRSIKGLSTELKIPENRIEKCHSYRAATRYLVHYDDDSKVQYNRENIHTNLDLTRFFNSDDTENEQVRRIMSFICNNPKCTLRSLMEYVLDNDLYSAYRRGYSLIRDFYHECNYIDSFSGAYRPDRKSKYKYEDDDYIQF